MKLFFSKNTIIILILFMTMACASGSSIVTGEQRYPIDPNMVKLYLEPPAKYEVIGLVQASSEEGFTAQDSQDYAIEELKNQAAQIGANGILLTETGENITTFISGNITTGFFSMPVSTITVSGKAIFVNRITPRVKEYETPQAKTILQHEQKFIVEQ